MADSGAAPDFDAIVIGAGVSGLYQLYRLREAGFSVCVYEAGGDVGGTWYWNRYPGARFDSESYTYGYSFSEELLQEWEWSEHFAPQPETLRYLNHVADKFDLRRDIRFDCRVATAAFDDASGLWQVELEDGERATGRFLIAAMGALSIPLFPEIEGRDSFAGEAYHTSLWPQEPVDFRGKRVGVIGTGATAVQLIPEVARDAAQLTVFQRRPNWCAPLHNRRITPKEQRHIKSSYADIFARCNETYGSFIHDADPRKVFEVSEEEREALYEKLYGEPGFGIWMGNFRDILVDPAANATISDFIARKVRGRVRDPNVAEKLIPKDHGFGTRRLPMETNYYEVYNQDNVRLVDLRETPIERITAAGIETASEQFDLDIIVYATGFDPITGPFDRIDIRGVGGQRLRDKWAHGPLTYLGVQFAGFPNLFALTGPHSAVIFANMPRAIEPMVDWVTRLLIDMREKGRTRVEATEEAERGWTNHVHQISSFLLMSKVSSWFTGRNTTRQDLGLQVMAYVGGAPAYRERLEEVAAAGYEGFSFR